jgi:hypothetical protein
MSKQMFVLAHDIARQRAIQAVQQAPAGFVIEIKEPSKSAIQERKYHAMINDIAKHCVFMNEKLSAEDWKRLLVDAFVRVVREEATAAGKPDPFKAQGRVLPSLDGSGIVQLGVQTRKFGKAIASEFIEYLYSYGCDNLVVWSESAMEAYFSVRRAA